MGTSLLEIIKQICIPGLFIIAFLMSSFFISVPENGCLKIFGWALMIASVAEFLILAMPYLKLESVRQAGLMLLAFFSLNVLINMLYGYGYMRPYIEGFLFFTRSLYRGFVAVLSTWVVAIISFGFFQFTWSVKHALDFALTIALKPTIIIWLIITIIFMIIRMLTTRWLADMSLDEALEEAEISNLGFIHRVMVSAFAGSCAGFLASGVRPAMIGFFVGFFIGLFPQLDSFLVKRFKKAFTPR